MDMTLAQLPLRKIAAEHPAALRIFDQFEIDLCHLGGKTLFEACAALHLSADQVQEKILGLASFSKLIGDPQQLSLNQIIQRIVRVHHRRIRQDLPALAEMGTRIEINHAARNPENIPLASLTNQLHREMFDHIGREEQVLFPFIALMEEESRLSYPAEHACFRAVSTPIGRMVQDHGNISEILEELRQRTNDFSLTRTACGTKRALFAGLKAFDVDTRDHMHLENNILFPRAIALESELAQKLECGSPA
jgi:regulator of cell morphogenesis and NO signaling